MMSLIKMPRTYKYSPAVAARMRKRRAKGKRNWRRNLAIARRKRAILSGFPQKKLVKLRYCQEVTLNAGAVGFSQQLFRTNSVFDPDYSGVGHQPKGFDEWAKIYSHYTVLGSKIQARMVTASTTNAVPGYTGILVDTKTAGVTTFTDIQDLLESKLAGKNWTQTGNWFAGTMALQRTAVLNKYFSTRKFFGIKNPQDGNSYSASVTANPSQEAYYCLWQYTTDANDPGAQVYMVTIDYIVEFRDPVSLTGS